MTTPSPSMRKNRATWITAGAALGLVAAIVVLLILTTRPVYSQATPHATLGSMVRLVREGRLDRVAGLIHTDDERLHSLLSRVGILMRRMWEFSQTVQERYPDEIASLRKRAENEAAKRLDQAVRDQEFNPRWETRLQRLLVDPLAAVDDELDRLDVVEMDEDLAAVTIDGKAAFGVGLAMVRLDDGKWYFKFPSHLPFLQKQMPQTDAEWRIMESLFQAAANGFEWAQEAVLEGEADSLEDATREVALNVGPNMGIIWEIYQQALRARPKDEPKKTTAAGTNPGGG